MASLNTYLNFLGNTEEVFNFYKSVFGGEFTLMQRFSDTPEVAANLPEEDKHKIMHVSLPIGKHSTLMGTDALESAGHSLTFGNNFSISITADTKEEADRIFKQLAEEGEIKMPLEMAFWGEYFGMLTDKYNVQWMMSFK
ncbi:MAG: VOC family protein [Flavobacteriia bacterium]|nr:VOC family protein [Flavobacteriia bacterium]